MIINRYSLLQINYRLVVLKIAPIPAITQADSPARNMEYRKMTRNAFAFDVDDRPFTRERRKSYTVPSRYYMDPAIYEAEKEAVFYRNWWLVGHVSRFAQTGSYVRVDVQDQGVLVIKGRDGEIRAFYNVCQHRGHEMVRDDAGRLRNLMVCPYHAWSYDFEGSLVRARNTENLPDFDKCNFGLKPVSVEILADFVYVNLDPEAESLGAQTEGMEQEMRHYMPKLGELEHAGRVTYEVNCNWKVLIDNFLECYHCHTAHPALVDLMDMDSYSTRTYRIHSSHIAGAPLSVDNAAYSFEKGDVDFGYAAWYLWPNLTIWAYPGEPLILTLQIVPTGPETSIEYRSRKTSACAKACRKVCVQKATTRVASSSTRAKASSASTVCITSRNCCSMHSSASKPVKPSGKLEYLLTVFFDGIVTQFEAESGRFIEAQDPVFDNRWIFK
jgi:choline monooxygenase